MTMKKSFLSIYMSVKSKQNTKHYRNGVGEDNDCATN